MVAEMSLTCFRHHDELFRSLAQMVRRCDRPQTRRCPPASPLSFPGRFTEDFRFYLIRSKVLPCPKDMSKDSCLKPHQTSGIRRLVEILDRRDRALLVFLHCYHPALWSAQSQGSFPLRVQAQRTTCGLFGLYIHHFSGHGDFSMSLTAFSPQSAAEKKHSSSLIRPRPAASRQTIRRLTTTTLTSHDPIQVFSHTLFTGFAGLSLQEMAVVPVPNVRRRNVLGGASIHVIAYLSNNDHACCIMWMTPHRYQPSQRCMPE